MLCQTQASDDLDKSIVEISNEVWELILQREFLGFTDNNLEWVNRHYVIPETALKRLGLNNT